MVAKPRFPLRAPLFEAREFTEARKHATARERRKIALREAEMREFIKIGQMAKAFRAALGALYCSPEGRRLRSAIRKLVPSGFSVGALDKFKSQLDNLACKSASRVLDDQNLASRVAYGERLTRRERATLVRMAGDDVLCEARRKYNRCAAELREGEESARAKGLEALRALTVQREQEARK